MMTDPILNRMKPELNSFKGTIIGSGVDDARAPKALF
jgi:hypothetical protein